MHNQRRWRPGKFISGNECEACECHGHADECFFDPQVEAEGGSVDARGRRQGGGVCIACRVRLLIIPSATTAATTVTVTATTAPTKILTVLSCDFLCKKRTKNLFLRKKL